MTLSLWLLSALLLQEAEHPVDVNSTAQKAAAAERFFRGVYGGDPSVVDQLAADDIVVSYPIFKELFGSFKIEGRDNVRDFAVGFNKRWADTEILVHESLVDGNRVVLLWSFKGRMVTGDDPVSTEAYRSWGGISFFRFNGEGRIVLETGEESEPGPIERL